MNRPDLLNGVTRRIMTGCGYIYVNINFDKFGYPVETLCTMSKSGVCASAQAETIGRLISLVLRKTDPKDRLKKMEEVIHQLKGTCCSVPTPSVSSCADGIGQALSKFMEAKK